jgi:hypothetical protein
MATALISLLAVATDVGGRGDNPDKGTGIVTIIVIVVLVLAVGLALAYGFTRGRAQRRSLERHPDSEGRVGRVGALRRR